MVLGTFGSYRVIKRIAVGGMGEIFLARHVGVHGFERLAVVKTVLEGTEEGDRREMFLAEARVAALLNHPNIAQVYELGEEDGTLYMAMEYVEGDTVGRIATEARKTGQVTPWPFVEIIVQAARGLDYAHQLKDSYGQALHFVHRDVSPQNIMVRLDGVAKVVDFGIAKVANAKVRTQTGTFKGKPAYMAPEQVRMRHQDARADIFALGVVLWELTVGRRMFPELNDYDILSIAVQEPRPTPSSAAADYPPELEKVVMKALCLEPDERWQTAAAFADALEAVLAEAKAADRPKVGDFVEALVGARVRERQASSSSDKWPQTSQGYLESDSPSPPLTDSPITQPAKPNARTPRTPSGAHAVIRPQDGTPTFDERAGLAVTPTPQPVPAVGSQRVVVLSLLAAVAAIVFAFLRPGPTQVAAPAPQPSPPPPVATPVTAATNTTPPVAASPAPAPSPVAVPSPSPAAAPAPGVGTTQVAVASPPPSEPSNRRPPTPAPVATKAPSKAPGKPQKAAETPAPAPAPTNTTTVQTVAAPLEPAGYLNLAPTPWANAFIDGRFVGVTPKYKLEVPAGEHTVRLENPDAKLRWEARVKVESGKTSLVQVKLE